MTCEIDERDDLARACAYLLPSHLASGFILCASGMNDGHAVYIVAHDLHAHAAGSAALDLVLVAKEVDARFTAPVIESTFG